MGELRAVLAALAAERAAGRAAVLATVVGVSGSGYRRPGARLAVLADGRRVGSVSGGCLDDDIARRAWWLTEGGPVVVPYDTGDAGDGPYRLGCGGTVRVLVERADPAALAPLHAAAGADTPVAVATVIATHGPYPAAVGARWVVGPAGEGDRTRTETVAAAGGTADVFVEVVRPPVRLGVFGGGPDVEPVVHFARALGWRVTVFDRRPAAVLRARFPAADAVASAGPDVPPGPLDAAVVMTHRFPDDLGWLRALLASPARYVGVLGARHRTARLLAELGDAAGRVFGPVGLDIGADAPAEIALAVVAEVRAVLAGRAGGHLRDRPGPVHDGHPVAGRVTCAGGES